MYSSIDMKPMIQVPLEGNNFLAQLISDINTDEEIHSLWEMANTTAENRLHMTDHGHKHFNLVANNALTMQRLMHQHKVKMNLERDYGLSYEFAEGVVFLASVLHDAGMAIHRNGHEEFSLFIVQKLLHNRLAAMGIRERTILIHEVLHAIISHRSDGKPLTIEAGIVRVADALDMTQGRTRIRDEDDSDLDIYHVSSLAIDAVEVELGTSTVPVHINIVMNHTAGIFQIDELLTKKVMGSGIEKLIEIKVYIQREKRRKLIKDYTRIVD